MCGRDLRSCRTRVAGLTALVRDRSGATAIEYGLICALMFLVLAGSVSYVANSTNVMYNKVVANMR